LTRSDGSTLTYTPDFYLPDRDEFIEVKGFMRLLDQEKLDLLARQYPKVRLTVISSTKFAELELSFKDLVAWECPVQPPGFTWDPVVDIQDIG
jgi:hypothetical protein